MANGERQCYMQKMWLGGKTECFQNVGGGEGVYDVLTFQKSRGGKSSPRGQKYPPNASLVRGRAVGVRHLPGLCNASEV